jgi:hypothetical protein
MVDLDREDNMAIDLTPKFRPPSVQDYSRGPNPLVAALQQGVQGFDQGQQIAQQYAERKRKQQMATDLQKYLENSPDPKHQMIAKSGVVGPDTVINIGETLARDEFKPSGTAGPGNTRNLYLDPKERVFTDQPIEGVQPYSVDPKEAVNILSGQNKQSAIQGRLDEMIQARLDNEKLKNDNMAKNRTLRALIAQAGINFKATKQNMDNLAKSMIGAGIQTNGDELLKLYKKMIPGDSPDATDGSVKVDNFTVTP